MNSKTTPTWVAFMLNLCGRAARHGYQVSMLGMCGRVLNTETTSTYVEVVSMLSMCRIESNTKAHPRMLAVVHSAQWW